jgi:tetratricopeptide (TPR) repeat protein
MDKVAKSHNNTAVVYQQMGDFAAASSHYQRALSLLSPAEREWQAHIKRNYALAYQAHGDYQEAKQMYRQALAYWRSVGNPELIATLEIDLSIIDRLLGTENGRISTSPIQGGPTRSL